MELTNAEALSCDLNAFASLEDHAKACVADYIACPNSKECAYDGVDNSCCTECKIKWLLGKWEGC